MMRLTPHTYRRLAFLASWSIIPEISDSCDAIVQIKNTIKQNTSSFPVFLNCSRESREVPEFIVPTLIEKNTNFFG